MTYDIKAYTSQKNYDNSIKEGYYLDTGYTKKGAIKEAKLLLKEGYKLVYVHSANDEEIIEIGELI